MPTRFLAIAALVTVLVGGCTGARSAPTSTPPAPTTAATSADPTPTRTGPLTTGPGVQPGEKPPTFPDAAEQHTPAGALAFAEFFIQALDWSAATTDPYLLERISSPACAACQRDIEQLHALQREGAVVQGGRIKITSDRLVSGTFKISSDYVVKFETENEAIRIARPSHVPTIAAPGAPHDTSLVFVSWHGVGWLVVGEGAPS